MKKIIFLIVLLFCSILIIPQTFPDYKERGLLTISDSLTTLNQNAVITATEGSIDPDEYIVGPGDKIFISISGVEEITQNIMVNQEGFLYIPKVGGIDLRKTTLNKSKEKILASINKYFKNVDIFISLFDFRRIKVNFLGDVKKSAAIVLPGNARLIDIVNISMGLTATSDIRNIKIVHKDGESNYFDLLSFLRSGDKKNNPQLSEGDNVIVDKIDKVVYISGAVKFPGAYEYKNGERVIDLIELSGGFTNLAREDSIEIVSFNSSGISQISNYFNLNELRIKNILTAKQDQIIIREKSDYFIDRYVSINGFVKYPGFYKIVKDSTTLVDIIKEAGGFKEEASLTEATLFRSQGITEIDPEFERIKNIPRIDMSDDEYDYIKAKSRQRKGRVIVDFDLLFKQNKSEENTILKRGDVISIPEAKNYITILGQVVNPGVIIYKPQLTVEDYINMSGGFGWRAQENDVRVIRAKTGEWIDADDVEELEPGDSIWILEKPQPPKFWDVVNNTLSILGQIAAVIAATVAVIIASR